MERSRGAAAARPWSTEDGLRSGPLRGGAEVQGARPSRRSLTDDWPLSLQPRLRLAE